MNRLLVILTIVVLYASPASAIESTPPSASAPAGTEAPTVLKDPYFGEALYYAFQGEWFNAIARLDTELMQHYGVDEPELDTLHYHINQARFEVGDFELAYRMHQRAGRAIKAVIEGSVAEPVRNDAVFRLARIYFQKDQPMSAQYAVERIEGVVPDNIRDDLDFLRAQILMANGRFAEAAGVLKGLTDVKGLEGFASYNLGIALIGDGQELEGREQGAAGFRMGGCLPGPLRKGIGALERSGDEGGHRCLGAGSHARPSLRLCQAECKQHGGCGLRQLP
jgi:hypothetical protein